MAESVIASGRGVSGPGSTALPRRVAPGRVLVVASFGAFLAFLDATVVNVAFPDIRESFPETSIGGLSWVLNAYNIAFASFLVVFGRLADLLGRRRLLTSGIAAFTAASVWCALATSLDMLVVARVAQALGAAMLVPASLAVVVEAFPQERRAHAVSLWGAAGAVAAGLGPPVGGALVELGGWRWAFLVNLPIGAVAWWLAGRTLVESRAPGRRRMPDVRGALLMAASLSALTLGLVQGSEWGWASPAVLGCFTAAVVLGVGFVASSRAHPQPLLDPALLRIKAFVAGNTLTVVAGAGFYAYMLTNILWLQYVWGYDILQAGLALVPGALVAAVVAARLGPVAQRRGYGVVLVPGALCWAAAYAWYAFGVGESPSFWVEWLPGQVLSGIGVGATLPVLGSAALAAVPGGRFATASAVLSSTRQLGGVLGIALLVVIIGSPTPATAATVLRDGWLFCAAAFLVVAVGSLLVREPGPVPAVETDSGDSAAATVQVPVRRSEPRSTDRSETYLARLPERVRTRLEESGRHVPLAAGEWLFRAGDQASEMYVVRSGRLEVLIGEELVRELGPGAILGELAMLTGGTRSASVRARRDTTLLRVSHGDFVAAMDSDPQAPLAIATALAEELQSPRPAGGSSSAPVVVAVVGIGRDAPVAEVAAALTAGLRRHHLRVLSSSGLDPDGLARAERDFDRVVLSASLDEHGRAGSWWESCLRQGDRVVLVARSDDAPPRSWSGPTLAELVLVGRPVSGEVLASWSEALDPWQTVLAEEDRLPGDLHTLAARLAARALGVVMAGGGARALSHVGVLQELEAAGVEVHRTAGASVGSIVAGLYASGHDAGAVGAICHEEFVRRRPFGDYTLPVAGMARGRRMTEALRRRLGHDARIESLPRQFRCVSVDLLARSPNVHRSGLLWQAAAASARLPVLFPPMRADGRLLVDGGVLDNLPVGLLTERDEGPVLAVNIGMGGGGAPRPDGNRPVRVPALGETLLRTMMIGSGGATDRAQTAGAHVLTPPSLGVGLLEFHQMDRMVEAGRMAARSLLEQTGGDLTART